MLNKQRSIIQTIKQPFNKALATAALLLALNWWDPSFAQTAQNNSNNKPTTTVTITTNDAFTFALENAEKYYPNTKEHLSIMLNSFRDQEHKDATLAIINQMIANITDPAQRVGAIIYFMEMSVFLNGKFSSTYDSKIIDPTFSEIEKADRAYKDRFKGYYSRLEANLEQFKQEVSDKEKQVSDKEKQVSDKEKQVSDKEKQVSDKEKQVSDKEKQVSDKEKQVSDKKTKIWEWPKQIFSRRYKKKPMIKTIND